MLTNFLTHEDDSFLLLGQLQSRDKIKKSQAAILAKSTGMFALMAFGFDFPVFLENAIEHFCVGEAFLEDDVDLPSHR